MSAAPRHKAELTGVSETALLTLYARASEARRPDAIIDDLASLFTRVGKRDC